MLLRGAAGPVWGAAAERRRCWTRETDRRLGLALERESQESRTTLRLSGLNHPVWLWGSARDPLLAGGWGQGMGTRGG